MNILVTGAQGFVGRNLCSQLRNIAESKACWYKVPSEDFMVMEYDMDNTPKELNEFCERADFVFNLAGVNRPKDQKDFMTGNFGFTTSLLNTLKKFKNTCPVMISSSIQAEYDNPYGESKRASERLLFDYSNKTGAKVLVYRFPNLFGKWCRPNYNSVVATFCNNIANGLPIQVNDPLVVMHLVYIDDVVDELIAGLTGDEHYEGQFCRVPVEYEITLGGIVDIIKSFRNYRNTLDVPNVGNSLVKKLYSTYLSYLPESEMSYPLKMNVDERGSFTEIFRTSERGQFSINISKPGVTKGQHWHHSKTEKFCVVSGDGLIQLRNINEPNSSVIEKYVSGNKLEIVDIPTGYIHNLVNIGTTDMITLIWCSECFDPLHSETYFDKM